MPPYLLWLSNKSNVVKFIADDAGTGPKNADVCRTLSTAVERVKLSNPWTWSNRGQTTKSKRMEFEPMRRES